MIFATDNILKNKKRMNMRNKPGGNNNKDFKYLKLWEYLPQKHKKRKEKNGRKMNRTLIPNRIDISLRSEEINNLKIKSFGNHNMFLTGTHYD